MRMRFVLDLSFLAEKHADRSLKAGELDGLHCATGYPELAISSQPSRTRKPLLETY